MKWPSLVQPWAAQTPVTVHLIGPMDEDGTAKELACIAARCSCNQKQHKVMTPDRQLIQLEGTLLFPGDLAPDVPVLMGTVEYMGRDLRIYRGSRACNPDGTVNYTQLEVM